MIVALIEAVRLTGAKILEVPTIGGKHEIRGTGRACATNNLGYARNELDNFSLLFSLSPFPGLNLYKLLIGKERGEGRNRTDAYSFCRAAPYHLATPPFNRERLTYLIARRDAKKKFPG